MGVKGISKMFKRQLKSLFLSIILILGLTQISYATIIAYDIDNLAGNSWEYTYTVTNDTLSSSIEEFTIYFDYDFYQNLNVTSSVSGWDIIVGEPYVALSWDGFYDALGSPGISHGSKMSGFSVSFAWLGTGTPGSQSFDIVNPLDYTTLDSGQTIPAAPVPEPSTLLLTGAGLAGVGFIGRRIKRS